MHPRTRGGWAKECIGREDGGERYHYEPPKVWVEKHGT
jgi:hypothetical protein